MTDETFDTHVEELIARVKAMGQSMGHDVDGWFKLKETAETIEPEETVITEPASETPLVEPLSSPLEHYSETAASVETEENHAG